MATRGRKPQPTQLKILRGNPGKRALPIGEPQPRGVVPDVPAHLDATAKAEWTRLADELHRLGLLTIVDSAALAAYCQAYSRWACAEREFQQGGSQMVVVTPNGALVQNPLIGIVNKAWQVMHRYLTEFGLSPSSRVRLAHGGPAEVEDPLDKFLKQGKKARR